MSMMLGPRYHRLNPQLPRNIPLDAGRSCAAWLCSVVCHKILQCAHANYSAVDDISELVALATSVDLTDTHEFIQVSWCLFGRVSYLLTEQNHWFDDKAGREQNFVPSK
jgi:hypothetical protein